MSRITLVSRPGSKGEVALYRPNRDPHSPLYGDRRSHLVISAPWGMPAAEILAALMGQLSDDEVVELAGVLGLGERHD